jgi:AAA+ superfamily predicted ATPase
MVKALELETPSPRNSADALAGHAATLERELAWLRAVIDHQFAARYEQTAPLALPRMPPIDDAAGPYAELVRRLALDGDERLLLILALAPHLVPELLDSFQLQNQATGRRFSEFGGVAAATHSGFLPTVETALFLLAGTDLALRLQMRGLFAPRHKLGAARVLEIEAPHGGEPPTAAALTLSREYQAILLAGEDDAPPADFSAERISTPLNWDDLVLDAVTREQIDMIDAWMRHGRTLMDDWGLSRRLKPGYRCLFHGQPGTGKTLTASLLGKQHQVPVYRVDLSRIVSKWIGETEKNLATLFDRAQDQNWILFFDEAEALFGRRTEASTSNDRSANQQIAYLLQRLEDFPGMVILSTNQRGHMDEAFARRFQSTILFPMPDAAARLILWHKMFRNGHLKLAPDIDFAGLAAQYALAGGSITNVLRYACLRAVARPSGVVSVADIMAGIKHELQKEGQYMGR